jgi:hypothetical protein
MLSKIGLIAFGALGHPPLCRLDQPEVEQALRAPDAEALQQGGHGVRAERRGRGRDHRRHGCRARRHAQGQSRF